MGIGFLIVPLLSPHPPDQISPKERFSPPSSEHWFGTDEVGRDLFVRVFAGGRLSLTAGASVVLLSGGIGLFFGVLIGYFGGWLDRVMMRVVDIMLAFPPLILALALSAALGPGLFNAVLAIVIIKIPVYLRLARAEVLRLRESLFVLAAVTFGNPPFRIIFRHVLPNAVTPIFVQMTVDIGEAILLISTLGFLGLGAKPPSPEWGAMISQGWKHLMDHWWIPTFPGLFLFLSVTALNLIGDGLQDILDPKARTDP
ncbi:ABC transporter permease [Hydrogenibacillus schlegelii]|nr:ABC transporter permease subunit [Hydrogenibacillus schlegelii]